MLLNQLNTFLVDCCWGEAKIIGSKSNQLTAAGNHQFLKNHSERGGRGEGGGNNAENFLRQDLVWGQALSTYVALGRKGRAGSRLEASLIVFGQPTTGPADPVINYTNGDPR